MPIWKTLRNGVWEGQGTEPTVITVYLGSPSSSGQTLALPTNFSFGTSADDLVESVTLLYFPSFGDPEPDVIGTTTTPTPFGWVIDLPADFTPGNFTFFGRATTTTGDNADSPHVVATIVEQGPPDVLTMLQPSTSGQTVELPFTASFIASENARITRVDLYRADPTFGFGIIGSTTTLTPFGFVVTIPDTYPGGPEELWGSATTVDGTFVDSVHRTVTLKDTPPPPTTGSRSLQRAIFGGGNTSTRPVIEARLGHKMPGWMEFGVSSSGSARTSNLAGHVTKALQRSNSDPYLHWVSYGLSLNTENLRNINFGNWANMGRELNRLSTTQLRNLIGIRLGWEFQGDWFRFGVTNTGVNGGNVASNCDAYASSFRRAVDAMRGQMAPEKRNLLNLDWCGSGGRMFRFGSGHGMSHWALTDRCYPGDSYVTVISFDAYNGDQHREGITPASNLVTMDGSDGPAAYCSSRAQQHGKKTGMSEGGPMFIKWNSSGFHGAMPNSPSPGSGSSNYKYLNRLLNWGQREADAGRLSHITFFERDKSEGRFMFIAGTPRAANGSFPNSALGNEGALVLYNGGIGASGRSPTPPNMRALNARAYSGVGSGRSGSNNVQSNDPACLNLLLDRVGGPIR